MPNLPPILLAILTPAISNNEETTSYLTIVTIALAVIVLVVIIVSLTNDSAVEQSKARKQLNEWYEEGRNNQDSGDGC